MSFAVGIDHPKREINVGTLWRSAHCFGARMLFTVGRRYREQASDVTKAWRWLPLLHFTNWDDYQCHAPLGWLTIGVEIDDAAVDLADFIHPKSAVYVLGAEDSGLSHAARAVCQQVVSIRSAYCLNVAVAGSIVMWDRTRKKGNT